VKKAWTLVGFSLALILFLPLVNATCSATIVGWDYNPKEVEAGGEVTVNANIEFKRGFGESCEFLVETAIIPQKFPYTLLPILEVIPHSKCCPANENFDDTKVTFGICANPVGCKKTEKLVLTLKAPTEESYDHCADCEKNPENCEPGFYWNGEGRYIIALAIWNGCEKDVETLVNYDKETSLIRVYLPSPPVSVCGDGVCDPDENVFNCPKDCLSLEGLDKEVGGLPLKYSDILIILVVVVIFITIYIVVK